MIALPPGAPRAAYEALRKAIERLNNDKDFAAEALKVIEFVPDYPTAPDMSRRVRDMLRRDARDAHVHQRLYAQRAEEVRSRARLPRLRHHVERRRRAGAHRREAPFQRRQQLGRVVTFSPRPPQVSTTFSKSGEGFSSVSGMMLALAALPSG